MARLFGFLYPILPLITLIMLYLPDYLVPMTHGRLSTVRFGFALIDGRTS